MADVVRRPLVWKYATALSALVTLPLLAGGLFSGWQQYETAKRSIEQLQEAEARSAAAEIAGFLVRIREALRASVAKFEGVDGEDHAALRVEFGGLLRHHPEIAALRWIDAAGREQLAVARVGIDEERSARDWSSDARFAGAREAGLWLGRVYFRKDSEPHVDVAVATTPGGRVLAAELNLKRVRDLVARTEAAVTYLVDDDGQLIAHPDIALVLARTSAAALPQVRLALHGSADAPAASLSGEPVIASHARVTLAPWTVIVEQPRARALAAVRAALLPALGVLAFGIAAALGASIVLARRMVRPIHQIEVQARQLGEGRFEAPIRLDSEDELQALAEQFNRMAERLQDTLASQERRIADRTHALKLANEAKTRFIAAASHDLRQPIHALALFVGQLRDMALPADAARMSVRAADSAQHLATLLDALLDLSQLDAGAVRAEPRAFALQPLLARVVQQLAPAAEAKGLVLGFAPTRAWVRSDPVLLERIVMNLVSNALRYTDSGRVLLGCRPRGDEIELLVADTGCGIAAEDVPKVFDEFWRARGGHRDGGIGLGLAIVRRLADLLDHRVWLDSELGRGTVARLRLPRATIEPGAGAEVTPGLGDPLQSCRVLIVDDDAAAREALQGLLARWGCEVRTADGLDAALAHASGSDVLLCDLELAADTDGVQVVEALRAAGAHALRCAFITGTSSPALLAKARATGLPIAFKPTPPARLRALLEHLSRAPGDVLDRGAGAPTRAA